MKGNDTVTLHLPRKADYASLVRLTISGIASKIGFDIDVKMCIRDRILHELIIC